MGSSNATVPMLTVQCAKHFPVSSSTRSSLVSVLTSYLSGSGQPVEKGPQVIVRMAAVGEDPSRGTFQEGQLTQVTLSRGGTFRPSDSS